MCVHDPADQDTYRTRPGAPMQSGPRGEVEQAGQGLAVLSQLATPGTTMRGSNLDCLVLLKTRDE